MKKENLYLIHGEDYLRHIEEKLELFWMANVLMCYIKDRADADSYLRLAYKGVRDFDERCGELFRSWGKAVRYIKSHDLADLSDLVENELIEPEYAGYVPADNPCCPGERCCEYAERMEREYAAEREADEDNEDADVFEYDGEPAISELTGVCRDILTAVKGLTTLLRDEFDYAPAYSHDDLDRSGNGFETGCRREIALCDDQQHLSGRIRKSLYSEGRSL